MAHALPVIATSFSMDMFSLKNEFFETLITVILLDKNLFL